MFVDEVPSGKISFNLIICHIGSVIGRRRGLVVRGAGRVIWRSQVQVPLQGHAL